MQVFVHVCAYQGSILEFQFVEPQPCVARLGSKWMLTVCGLNCIDRARGFNIANYTQASPLDPNMKQPFPWRHSTAVTSFQVSDL